MIALIEILKRFRQDRRGVSGITFSLMAIPLIGFVGAAVDLSIARKTAEKLQMAVDSGTLIGATSQNSSRDTIAKNGFQANFMANSPGLSPTSSFAPISDPVEGEVYGGSASVTIPTTLMKIFGINTVTITRTSRATFATSNPACILTFGKDLGNNDVAMEFNGSPSVDLMGCIVRSNQKIKCNGNSIGAGSVLANDTAVNCDNSRDNSGAAPDDYVQLASSIPTKVCGTSNSGVTWSTSGIPSGPAVFVYQRTGYKEVHVCGPLNLEGAGTLGGSNANEDLVIVVENGDVNIGNNMDMSALRTTIILTGTNNSHEFDFPNGAGKLGKLHISSSIHADNPWKGMAIYQDPTINDYVSASWGPGAHLTLDGIAYMPKTNLTLSGNADTGPSECSRILTNSFTVNGNVTLKQDATGCADQQVSQGTKWPRLIL